MTRYQLLSCGWLLTLYCLTFNTSAAQVLVWPVGQTDFPMAEPAPSVTTDAGEPLPPNLKLIRLSAAAEPIPALKYRLWVSPSLRRPGDATAALLQAQILYLSHPERAELDSSYEAHSSDTAGWPEMPLTELPESGVRDYLSQQRAVLDQVYVAANLRTITAGDASGATRGLAAVSQTMPEQQNNRALARLISLDARLAIAEGRFDESIESIAAGFRLAELTHEGTNPTLLTRLVSIAITGMMLSGVEELSQQPGAPNLYWALASLPPRLWDLRSALEGESAFMARVVFPLLEPIAAETQRRAVGEQLVQSIETFVATDGNPFEGTVYPAGPPTSAAKRNSAARLIAGLIVLGFADASHLELPELGFAPTPNLSHTEATLRAIQLTFARGRDNIFKWGLTPTGIGDEFLAEMNWLSGGDRSLRPANVMLGLLVPAVQAAESAVTRVNSQHKQLLLREALRGYAAAHAGELPTDIESLRPLVAWPNPVTGKMFDYQRQSPRVAIIRRDPFYTGEQPTDVRVELR